MDLIEYNRIKIRRLIQGETIPYKLLLLADPSREMIDSYVFTSEIYVVQISIDIVASCVLYAIAPDLIEIKNIAVDTNYQGQGLGKFLLAHVCFVAKEKGFKRIIIGTANSSIAQLYLYQSQGFEMSEIKKDFFIQNYSEPIYENGILAKHMVILTKVL